MALLPSGRRRRWPSMAPFVLAMLPASTAHQSVLVHGGARMMRGGVWVGGRPVELRGNCTLARDCASCLGVEDAACVWCPESSMCTEFDKCANPDDNCPPNYLYVVIIWMVLSAMLCLCCLTCTTRRCLREWRMRMGPYSLRDSESLDDSLSEPLLTADEQRAQVYRNSLADVGEEEWRCALCGFDNRPRAKACCLCATTKQAALELASYVRVSLERRKTEMLCQHRQLQQQQHQQQQRQQPHPQPQQQQQQRQPPPLPPPQHQTRTPLQPPLNITPDAPSNTPPYMSQDVSYGYGYTTSASSKLSLRQKAARRRRLWQRRVGQDGMLTWVRVPWDAVLAPTLKRSHVATKADKALKQPTSASSLTRGTYMAPPPLAPLPSSSPPPVASPSSSPSSSSSPPVAPSPSSSPPPVASSSSSSSSSPSSSSSQPSLSSSSSSPPASTATAPLPAALGLSSPAAAAAATRDTTTTTTTTHTEAPLPPNPRHTSITEVMAPPPQASQPHTHRHAHTHTQAHAHEHMATGVSHSVTTDSPEDTSTHAQPHTAPHTAQHVHTLQTHTPHTHHESEAKQGEGKMGAHEDDVRALSSERIEKASADTHMHTLTSDPHTRAMASHTHVDPLGDAAMVSCEEAHGCTYGGDHDCSLVWSPAVRHHDTSVCTHTHPMTTRPSPHKEGTAEHVAYIASLPFRRKQLWFLDQIARIQVPWSEGHIRLDITRANLLEDSFSQLMALHPSEMREWMRVHFVGEPGVDAGGLEREFFILVTRALFDPALGLFTRVADGAYAISPALTQPESGMDHALALQYYRFAGRILGKALMEHQTLPVHLCWPLYKAMVGYPMDLHDTELVDADLYSSLLWVRNNPQVDVLHLDFTVTCDSLGQSRVFELKPGGASIQLTDDNKDEYVSLMVKYWLLDSITPQLWHLLKGMYEVVPQDMLSVFDYMELELLLCGQTSIDVSDWKRHTEYFGQYSRQGERHPVVRWFWEVVEGLEEDDRRRLLQFITGACNVPAQGFKTLQSNDGNFRRFNIQSVRRQDCMFPRAHTCFNKLDLPLYESKEELESCLRLVIGLDLTGFTMD